MFDIFGKREKEIENANLNLQMIDFREIYVNPKNFFEINKIDELAEDILENGLNHPIAVIKKENGYMIIDGERRFTAIKSNIKNNRTHNIYVPCIIKKDLNDLEVEKRLILANLTSREITPFEKLKSIERLEILFKAEKENGKLPKRIRTLIAEATGLKETQVGTYQSINRNAIEEVKEKLQAGEITVEAAHALSTLDEEEQEIFIADHDNISKNDVEEYRNKNVSVTDTIQATVKKLTFSNNVLNTQYNLICEIMKEYQCSEEFKELKDLAEKVNIVLKQVKSKIEGSN